MRHISDIPLPRLLDSNLNEVCRLSPTQCSLSLSVLPLSTARMRVVNGNVKIHDWIELYAGNGKSAGIFRVAKITTDYYRKETRLDLEHGLTILGNSVIPHGSTRTETDLTTKADKEAMGDLAKYYTPVTSTGSEKYTISGDASTVIKTLLNFQNVKINGQNPWTFGACELSENLEVEIEYNNILELLTKALEDYTNYYIATDQSSFPWKLSVKQKVKTPTAEGRLSRNVESCEIIYDDGDLCTRVYVKAVNKKYESSNIGKYGVFEQALNLSDGIPTAEADKIAERFLSNRDEPAISISVTGQELYAATGESLDSFDLGKCFRLALPDYDIVLDECIIGLNYSNVYTQPGSVQVDLANKTADLSWDSSRGNSYGAGSGASSLSEAAETASDASDGVEELRKTVQRIESDLVKYGQYVKDGEVRQTAAGIIIDPNDGVLLFAKDQGTLGYKMSELRVRADAIEQKVEDTEKNLRTTITTTAEGIRADMTDADNRLSASITATAEKLTSEYKKYTDDAGNTLNTKIEQTASQIRSEASDTARGLQSSITQAAADIRSEVSDTARGLQSSITQNAESITAQAEKITLIANDYVTINKLQTEIAALEVAFSDTISTSSVTAGFINTDGISVGGSAASWQSQYVVTQVSYGNIVVKGTDGNSTVSCINNVYGTTLNYLG